VKKIELGVVLARVPNNEISSYIPMFSAILEAAESVGPGEVVHVFHPNMRV
jgi:hypothetical protein